ncbi:hypothetical protein OX283_000895 [Flavobacterium sp. SUN052]|uniref:DUF7683 domain-containing protein n=1 Tax=Flavobacterium sp. SUN052 TaxID=3002441 RepID=UPI00237E5FD0|nr:hypothetical protein [Flavobacterium sp. SUN052]MEC4003198.1 hypothetical protein [Flavobacterium sp. SUN052]
MIIREIAVYSRVNDNHIESYEIDLSVDELITILNVDIDKDPNVYMIYEINETQYSLFLNLIPSLKVFDLENVELFYECFQSK